MSYLRFDSQGLFWTDEQILTSRRGRPKSEKVQEKRTPPERTWEAPDYLPHLDEAQSADIQQMTDQEIVEAAMSKDRFFYDVECTVNYFLVCFKSLKTKKGVFFELSEDQTIDTRKLAWVIQNLTVVGFNSRAYDYPVLQLAMKGASNAQLWEATIKIIKQNTPSWKISDENVKALKHIDLIAVAPLDGSLKTYGGRLHAPRLWDLPFPPGMALNREQRTITRWYCWNDLELTEYMYEGLREQIELRETLEQEYAGLDLCSLSDAQIAEAVITHELAKIGVKAQKGPMKVGEVYKYIPPPFLKFQSEYLQAVFNMVCSLDFIVGNEGYTIIPEQLTSHKVRIGEAHYQMGMGGLHSSEKCVAYVCDGSFVLKDRDVTSYYPKIALNCRFFPPHLGEAFLTVYDGLVKRRVLAKKNKQKAIAESLKITVNGSFGKTANKYSVLYAPNMMFQITLTGQLSLLMLIEDLEKHAIQVVSANTDGIVLKVPCGMEEIADECIKRWEATTGFETEETEYKKLFIRDVNNYIAVKRGGGVKLKGAFANPWGQSDQGIYRFHKNPVTTICIEAVCEYLENGKGLRETIESCKDVRKFVSIRKVKNGAVYAGQFLGKVIRWYYAKEPEGEMVYADSGNLVPKSQGAAPLMALPHDHSLPADINLDWYVQEAEKLLKTLSVDIDDDDEEE